MKKQIIALTGALTLVVGTFAGASAASAKTVKINSGDTLSELALTHGTTVETLKQLNGLSSDLIYAGASLEVGNGTTQTTYKAPVQQKQAATYKAPVQQKQAATYKAPVQQKQATTYKAPVQQKQTTTYKAPVQQKQTTTYKAPVQQKQTTTYKAPVQQKQVVTGSSSSAKSWIANRESSNSYSARSASGDYVGKYQLHSSYLNGDYSAANQERVADNYVKQRYGSWDKAKAFHQANGWY